MAEHSTHTRRRAADAPRRVPTSILVLAFIFVAGLGYIGGTYHAQIIASVAPLVGLKAYGGTLDVTSLQNTYQTLKANYDGDIDDQKLIEGANKGLVEAAGDPYTVYMNQTETEAFDNELSGAIGGGVGIELSLRNEVVTVVRVLKDNPADKVGVKVGDVLLGVNDEERADWTTEEAVSKIRGEIGTTVKVTMVRGEEKIDFTITRQEINNPSVYGSIQDGIGVMTITRFDSETGGLAREVAQDFKSKGVKSVVLDLRNNGGGYVTAAQDVAGIWLSDKIVVTEKNGDRTVDEIRTSKSPLLDGIPTVVLVNEGTASASEIVAGALQDYGVAQLVGQKTFGKGSVQKLISLPEGGQLKVTIARWYTPNGKNISEEGITPAKEVTITSDDINSGRDPQLDAAKALVD